MESVESNDLEGVGSTPARTAKLYAITRADLAPGLRTAQVGHALIAWVLAHGTPPDNLVVLQVPDLTALSALAANLEGDVVRFHEPDLADALTAIAAGPATWRALSSIPLMR